MSLGVMHRQVMPGKRFSSPRSRCRRCRHQCWLQRFELTENLFRRLSAGVHSRISTGSMPPAAAEPGPPPPFDELTMTRDLIADILVARCEGITKAPATGSDRCTMCATARTFARFYAKLRNTNPRKAAGFRSVSDVGIASLPFRVPLAGFPQPQDSPGAAHEARLCRCPPWKCEARGG